MPKCYLFGIVLCLLGLSTNIANGTQAQDLGSPIKLTPENTTQKVQEDGQPFLGTGELEISNETSSGADQIKITTLKAVDPSSIGLLDESVGGLGANMWEGTDRTVVEMLLPRLPMGTLSRPMQNLARRLLLSTARVPKGEAIAPSLLGLRVERLSAGGDTESINELLSLAPARLHDRAFARARIDGQLLAGNHSAACEVYKELISDNLESSYWLKGLTFCKALKGEKAAVRFAVDLLQEIEQEDDRTFFILIDSLSGNMNAQLTSLVDPKPLHLAMLQVARLPVPASAVPGAPPPILRAIAQAPNATLEVRLAAAERAEAAGALSAEALAEIYKGVLFTDSEISMALDLALTEPESRANALLFQAGQIEQVPFLQAKALQLAWQLGYHQGRFGTAARVNLEAVLSIEPSADLSWFAADAVRALLAAGAKNAAFEWFTLAQQIASVEEPEAAIAVDEVWPLIFLSEPNLGEVWDPKIAELWWQALDEVDTPDKERYARATLVFTLLESFDFHIPNSLWSALMDGSLTETAYVPSTPLWRNLESSSRGGRIGETVLLSLLALGEGGPWSVHPHVLGEVITALRAIGMEQEAREIALDAALAIL